MMMHGLAKPKFIVVLVVSWYTEGLLHICICITVYLQPGTHEMPRTFNTAVVVCFIAIAWTDNPNSLPPERHSDPGYVESYVRTAFLRYER
jgi:hypothetical protein